MYSDTHSCTHSLASFDTFADEGNEFFMILATFAICHAVSAQVDRRGKSLRRLRDVARPRA